MIPIITTQGPIHEEPMIVLEKCMMHSKGENKSYEVIVFAYISLVGLGRLGVTCSPRDPRFAGSNPAEVDGFYSGHKNPEQKSSGRDFNLGVLSLVKEPQA